MASKIAITLVACILLFANVNHQADGMLSCQDVFADVHPCLNFLKGIDKKPSSGCCKGVGDVAKNIKNKKDRNDACVCVKNSLDQAQYDPNLLPQISPSCGIDFVIPPIDKHTDCSKA